MVLAEKGEAVAKVSLDCDGTRLKFVASRARDKKYTIPYPFGVVFNKLCWKPF